MPRRLVVALTLLFAAATARAGRISGRLLDGNGNAVAGSRVAWTAYRTEEQVLVDQTADAQPPKLGETRTGADGRFAVSLDGSGPSVSLAIETPALPGASLTGPFDPTATTDLGDIELPAPRPVTGAVLATGGPAVAGARVAVRSASAAAGGAEFFAEAVSGADGKFTIPNAPSGPSATSVRAKGFVPYWRVSPPGRAQAQERIVLEPGGTVSGTVTDVSGKPAAGAIVLLGLAAVRTDSSGRYRLAAVAAGARTVEAISGEDLIARRGNVAVRTAAEATVDLRLAAAASIAGTVVDEKTRRPIVGAYVRVLDSGRPRKVVATDAQGKFRAPGLEPGKYTVRAERTGYLATSLTGITAAAGTARSPAVAIALEPAASIAGSVVGREGQGRRRRPGPRRAGLQSAAARRRISTRGPARDPHRPRRHVPAGLARGSQRRRRRGLQAGLRAGRASGRDAQGRPGACATSR